MVLLAALFLVSATGKTFANEIKVTPLVMQSLEGSFRNASNVHWSIVDHMYKADFTQDDEQIAAFFSIEDGSLIASGRYLSVSQLPRVLQRSLNTTAASALIIEVFEVQGNDGTDYFATIQKDEKNIILKAAGSKWNVYKKD